MAWTRVIPVMLLSGEDLVKTRLFRDPVYLGDPRNAIRIFNEKQADEIAVLDIEATACGRRPDFALVEEIAGEAFMPMTYGGGVASAGDVRALLGCGVEKVAINTAGHRSLSLLQSLCQEFGSSSIVGSMDVDQKADGAYRVVVDGEASATDPAAQASRLQQAGVGEIMLQAIHRDGTRSGMDLKLIETVASVLDVPLVVGGGARHLEDVRAARAMGADAVAMGAGLVFLGPSRESILITYPDRQALDDLGDGE